MIAAWDAHLAAVALVAILVAVEVGAAIVVLASDSPSRVIAAQMTLMWAPVAAMGTLAFHEPVASGLFLAIALVAVAVSAMVLVVLR